MLRPLTFLLIKQRHTWEQKKKKFQYLIFFMYEFGNTVFFYMCVCVCIIDVLNIYQRVVVVVSDKKNIEDPERERESARDALTLIKLLN